MAFEVEANAAIVPQAHERRFHHRDDLCFKVRFSILHGRAASYVQDRIKLENDGDAEPTDESFMENISSGGLGLCGYLENLQKSGIKEGDLLHIEIQPPRVDLIVRCLGRVAWVEIHEDTGMFRSGVTFLAVNAEDLKKMRPLAQPPH